MRKRNRKVKVMGLAGMLMVGLAAGSLPAELVSAVNGWEVDLNAGGTAEASSVSITMGGGTANGQLSAGSTDPNKSAGLVKRTASVEIGATDGYTVTLSGNPNLTGVDGSNKIPTVTSNTTLAQMNNQWGWYTAEGDVDCSALQTMKQMKTTGDQIAAGTLNAKTTKQFTMCFGAKVNGNQAADTYSNMVTLSVVAQPKVVQTFGGIKTMQEMTSSICGAAAVNDTAYLRDTRDNKSYWVTKLADGNCWMSQNLGLDITTSNVKAADSDVTSDWNSSSSYPPVATAVSVAASVGKGTDSWDLGQYVLNTPIATTACGNNTTGLSACAAQGFVDVSGWTASSDPNFYRRELYNGTDGSTCTKSANSAVNKSATSACRVYDAHYLVGNYYVQNAAAAGTATVVGSNASESVCPRGWKLPGSATNDSTVVSGTYADLLQEYGLATAWNTGSASGVADGYEYNIALSPLFFVRGGENGNYDVDAMQFKRTLSGAGSRGTYWSSYYGAYDGYGNPAFFLVLRASDVNPSSSYTFSGQQYGRSVRCLAR